MFQVFQTKIKTIVTNDSILTGLDDKGNVTLKYVHYLILSFQFREHYVENSMFIN